MPLTLLPPLPPLWYFFSITVPTMSPKQISGFDQCIFPNTLSSCSHLTLFFRSLTFSLCLETTKLWVWCKQVTVASKGGTGGGQYFFLFFLFFCLKFHVSLYSSISYYRQGHEMTYSQSSSVFWSLSESIFLSITVRLAEQTHLSFQQMLRFTMTTRETARCNPARSLFFYFLSVAAALSVMSSL